MANVMNMHDKYEDAQEFDNFMSLIGLTPAQRQRLKLYSFTTMNSLVDHYKSSGANQLQAYLKDLNKTFATSSAAALRVHYNPGAIGRIVGCFYYFYHLVHSFHSMMDISTISMDVVNRFSSFWDARNNEKTESNDEDDVNIPELKGHTNWISFKYAFMVKLRAMKNQRVFLMEYLLDDEPRDVE